MSHEREEDSYPEMDADRHSGADCFERIYRAFLKAGPRTGEKIEGCYRLAGRTFRLRFAGDTLASKLTPALSHLVGAPDENPDLEICLWDSRTTGMKLPPPDWMPHDHLARGEIRGFNRGRILAAFQTGPDILNMYDRERKRGLFWIRDAHQVPFYESAAPLRTILHWWMRTQGCQVIHAGAFGTDSCGVLLAGGGGAGKSTAALALGLSPGMEYAADDYCLLEPEPAPWIHSLYATAKLDGGSLKRLAHLALPVDRPRRDGGKTVIYFQKRYSANLISGFPLKAVLCPRITGSDRTAVRAASSGESFRALAVSSVFQLPGAGSSDLNRIAAAVREVPAFTLELGTDMIEAVRVVKEWWLQMFSEERERHGFRF